MDPYHFTNNLPRPPVSSVARRGDELIGTLLDLIGTLVNLGTPTITIASAAFNIMILPQHLKSLENKDLRKEGLDLMYGRKRIIAKNGRTLIQGEFYRSAWYRFFVFESLAAIFNARMGIRMM